MRCTSHASRTTRTRLEVEASPGLATSTCPVFQQPPHSRDHASGVLLRERMLPNPDDAPPRLLQQPRHRPIAPLIADNFPPPEFRVLSRPRRMRRTAVPETAIHEHNHLLAREHEVGLAAVRSKKKPTAAGPWYYQGFAWFYQFTSAMNKSACSIFGTRVATLDVARTRLYCLHPFWCYGSFRGKCGPHRESRFWLR